MRKDFSGKIAVVTGSTQGLGAAVARQMVDRGVSGVVITGRDAERGAAVAQSIVERGARAVFEEADLTDPAVPARIIGVADDTFGRIDVLVNSAGITDRDTIFDSTPEFFDRMMTINTKAPWFLMQGAIKAMMREGNGGTIVNVLSISSHAGQPYIATYCASKAALEMAGDVLAEELAAGLNETNGTYRTLDKML